MSAFLSHFRDFPVPWGPSVTEYPDAPFTVTSFVLLTAFSEPCLSCSLNGPFCLWAECICVSYKCQLLRLADHTFLYITIAELVEKKPPSCTMSLYYVATGQMLINWFLSAFPEEHYLRLLLTSQDLRIVAAQFCTHLLAAGVLRQIPDKDVTLEPLFRVSKPLHNG